MKNLTKLKVTNVLIELPYQKKFYSLFFTPLKYYIVKIRRANLTFLERELTIGGNMRTPTLNALLTVDFLDRISLTRINSFNNFKANIYLVEKNGVTILDNYLNDFKVYTTSNILENILYDFFTKKYINYHHLISSFKRELLFYELLFKNGMYHEELYINGVYNSLHAPFINKFFNDFDDTELIREICNYYFEIVNNIYSRSGDFITHCDKISRKVLKLAHRYDESSKIMPFDWFVEFDELL